MFSIVRVDSSTKDADGQGEAPEGHQIDRFLGHPLWRSGDVAAGILRGHVCDVVGQ